MSREKELLLFIVYFVSNEKIIITMITLNVQIGVNPIINHKPKQLYKDSKCRFTYTIGENGEMVAWKDLQPYYQMCPSLNAEADKLIAITAASIRDIEQVKQTKKIVTLHNDNRLRIWAEDDGSCLNVSPPGFFPQNIIALIAPKGQCRFIIALAEESFYVVDCWVLKFWTKVVPKKQAYARFKGGSINAANQLELFDGNNRSYKYSLNPLFNEHFLDFGYTINNFDKNEKQIDKVCKQIASIQIQSFYKKQQPTQMPKLKQYEQIINKMKQQSLAEVLLCPELIRDYPALHDIFLDEQPTISTLHFISGVNIFMFVGTKKGTIFVIPLSTRVQEPLVLVKDLHRTGTAVRYIRIFNSNLFVSWEDGWLAIYNIQNIVSHLEIFKINRVIEQQSKKTEVWCCDLYKLCLLQEKLSSFMKYSLPAYHNIDGKLKTSYFFRLDRNEIIRFDQSSNSLTHYRGISEDTKVYCVFILEQYVGICTSKGIQMYSPLYYERTIDYTDWIWSDFPFFTDPQTNYQYRHSDYHNQIINGNGMIKLHSRWVFDKLDYCSHGEQIFNDTFGDARQLTNQQFPGYYFLQKGQVLKALHSESKENFALILKMKLNRIRKDCWDNAAFLIHGNLNAQLDDLQGEKSSLQEILQNDFEFYMLLPWNELNIPFLSKHMKNIGKRVCLKRRQTVQGVGKSFTIHLQEGTRVRLSEKILCHEAVAAVGLLQCWVLKDPEITDYMVEAVQYFARLLSSLFGQAGDIVLAKLAISGCQHISKASINIFISKAITNPINIHPIFEYFLLNRKEIDQQSSQLLSYNETVWSTFLGLGFIFSNHKIQQQHMRMFVRRFISLMQDLNNYEKKPQYLLTIMRVFNQGVSSWHKYLQQQTMVIKLLTDLFKVFFYYDAVSSIAADDKKFNFVFAKCDQSFRKMMKQGLVKTIIYIGKEFPQQFHMVLKNQTVNQKIHNSYPSSVIEILRQFVKSEKPQNHLVFYVQLLLQCLSPMTPQLRKYVQKTALNTLQLLCTYSNISFNQPSQKLSVKTNNHLYIYCLRTSTKWRTINLRDQKPHNGPSLVQMSPKGTYIALLSDKLRIWRLSSGFWSGVLGAFSQDWVFEAQGKLLRWQENQNSITVINENPSLNKAFKI